MNLRREWRITKRYVKEYATELFFVEYKGWFMWHSVTMMNIAPLKVNEKKYKVCSDPFCIINKPGFLLEQDAGQLMADLDAHWCKCKNQKPVVIAVYTPIEPCRTAQEIIDREG